MAIIGKAGAVIMMVLIASSQAVAGGEKGAVLISATVASRVVQTTVRQESRVTITDLDIAKGYVDVPAGSLMTVKNNNHQGYFLNFYVDARFVTQASVAINGRTITMPLGNGLVHRRFAGNGDETLQISYRFWLASDIPAGSYQWPVAVAASSM